MGELLRIPARGDGFALAAELFFPSSPPKAAVLVAGAMGVKASFYAPLAEYMSRRGAAALTVDYRGIGGSRPRRSLRHFHATFHDWGERDLAGALEWLAWRVPEAPLLWVGHSAGAQLMGLVPDPAIGAALFVAAGTAYWKGYPMTNMHRRLRPRIYCRCTSAREPVSWLLGRVDGNVRTAR